jgi:hypothetical protein
VFFRSRGELLEITMCSRASVSEKRRFGRKKHEICKKHEKNTSIFGVAKRLEGKLASRFSEKPTSKQKKLTDAAWFFRRYRKTALFENRFLRRLPKKNRKKTKKTCFSSLNPLISGVKFTVIHPNWGELLAVF